MSPAVADDLILSFLALLTLLLVAVMIAVFKPARPDLNGAAAGRLDDLIVTFKQELGSKAQATAAARGSEISTKDIQTEYRKRRAGWIRHFFRALLSYRAFALALAGLIFTLPIIPHFHKLFNGHRQVTDGAGAAVAFITFGLEGSAAADRVRSIFWRTRKSANRADNRSQRYCERLKHAVEKRARKRAVGTETTCDDIQTAWDKLVKPYQPSTSVASSPKPQVLRGPVRWLTALAVGAGLYFGVSSAATRLRSDSYWPVVAIPCALLIFYLILANGLRGPVGALERSKPAVRIGDLASELVRRPFERRRPHQKEHAMTYGGPDTKRPAFSIARLVALAGEAIGLLNKGSADAPAAPGSEAPGQAISADSLNVTRVGGVGALIGGAGGAALLLFNVNKSKDPHSIVVAAYIGVGVIVAASLLAVALIIVADIRARAGLASIPAAARASVAQVKYIRASGITEMAVSLDRAYDFVIVNAAATGLKLTLPDADSARWQQMLIRREDNSGNTVVTLLAQNQDQVLGQRVYTLDPVSPLQLYSNGQSWLAVQ